MAKPIIVRLYKPRVLPMMFGIATIPQMVGSVLGLPPYIWFFPSNHPILRNLPSNPIFRCQFKFPSSIDPENHQVLVVSLIFQPLPWSNCWRVPDAPVTRSKSCQRASCGDHVGWWLVWSTDERTQRISYLNQGWFGVCWKVQLICHKQYVIRGFESWPWIQAYLTCTSIPKNAWWSSCLEMDPWEWTFDILFEVAKPIESQ